METNIKLIYGDAIESMKNIESCSVDLIIADPPYNLGKDYGTTKDSKNFDDYMHFSRQWLTEAHRILKDNGTMYIFMGVKFISYIYYIVERELGMELNSWITWYYTQGIGKTKGFSPRHDDILMFNKSSNFTFNLDDVRVPQKYYRQRNNMRGANPGNVWEFSHVHYCNKNRQNHPTQKPEGIMERMILASSNEGDVVLDPFMGSGTTVRVAQQLNRRGIGIDNHEEYIRMVEERLAEPFEGFDSIDVRMKRVPLDLRDETIRNEYLKNHIEWFLKHHEGEIEEFYKEVKNVYSDSPKKSRGRKKKSEVIQDKIEVVEDEDSQCKFQFNL